MACGTAGLAVIGLGALLIIVGLVMLIRVVSRIDAESLTRAKKTTQTVKGPAEDLAKLVQALNETIKLVGVARGVSLMVIVLGILLVVVGAGVANLLG